MDTSELVWLLIGCGLVIGYLVLVAYIVIDLIRRDLSAAGKVAWFVAFLVVPVLSVIVYVIARGDDPHPYPGRGRPNVSN